MAIEHIHSYLVHPEKYSESKPKPGGVTVPMSGEVYEMLHGIYQSARAECQTEIAFRPDNDGKQANECQDLLIDYLRNPSLPIGRKIAARLATVTDRRSGLGLLFLLAGKEGRDHKIVISRFPTKSAISADEVDNSLTVSYLKRVFLKSSSSYKAAVYQRGALAAGALWIGHAVDRQLGNQSGEYPDYWISDFLDSTQTVTAAAGTNRFARAIRDATKDASPEVKRELVAAATLATGLKGQRVSISDVAKRFGLSNEANAAIVDKLKSPRVADEQFQFDEEEFSSIVAFRSVDLNNEATLTAPSSSFNEIFQTEIISSKGEVRFSTQGKIVDERLRKIR